MQEICTIQISQPGEPTDGLQFYAVEVPFSLQEGDIIDLAKIAHLNHYEHPELQKITWEIDQIDRKPIRKIYLKPTKLMAKVI